MSTSVSYINEKFFQAIFALATGEGDARSRVDVAYHCFWHIPVEDFPEALREDRKTVETLLTRLDGRKGHIIPDNLSRMTNSDAAEIARLIVDIYFQLDKMRPNKPA